MPLYEYQCQSCGKRFERLQRFSDPPVAECPHCQGPVEKLISSPAIQFKGSGWYITDYARKSGSGGESAGGAKDSSGTADSKSSASKDSSSSSTSGSSSGSSSASGEGGSPGGSTSGSSSSAPKKSGD